MAPPPLLSDPPAPAADSASNFDVIIKHGHQDLVQAVAFNTYGDRCATGSVDGKIRVFNRHKDGVWRHCDSWGAHGGEILELQWLPPTIYPNLIASLGIEGRFKLWAEDPSAAPGRRFSHATGLSAASNRVGHGHTFGFGPGGIVSNPGGSFSSSTAASPSAAAAHQQYQQYHHTSQAQHAQQQQHSRTDASPKAVFETRNARSPYRSFSMRHVEESRHTYLALLAADGRLTVYENEMPENLAEWAQVDEFSVFADGGKTNNGAAGGGGGGERTGGGQGAGPGGIAATGSGSGGGPASGANPGGGNQTSTPTGTRRPARGEESSFRVRFDPNPDVCYTALRAGVPPDALGLVVAAMDAVKVYRTRDTVSAALGVATPGKEFYLAAEMFGHGGLVREVAWAPGNIRGYDVIATACQDGYVRVFRVETPGGEEKVGWSSSLLVNSASSLHGGDKHSRGTGGGSWGAGDGTEGHPKSGIRAGLAQSRASADRRPNGLPGQIAHSVAQIAKMDSHRTPVWRVGFDDDGQVLGSVGDEGRLICYRQTPDGGWAKSSELSMLKMRMAAP